MAPKRRHDEMSSTTQHVLDQQKLDESSPSISRASPPFVLQDIFPNEIIAMILEYCLQYQVPIKLPNRQHANAPLERKKGDRTKYFWEQGEGVFRGTLTTPSPRRDAYRARFLVVNTFIVDRLTEHKMQHATSCHPRYIGSVLDEWPESYQHIRSLIIGRNIPIERRDAVARACPNLTHLKILDLPSYVPETFKRATRKVYNHWCGTDAKNRGSWARPPLGSGEGGQALLDFLSHAKLCRVEFQCDRYYTMGTGQVTEKGWFTHIVATEVTRAFCRAEREVRVEVVGKGQSFVSFCLPAEDGSFVVPRGYGLGGAKIDG